MRVRWSPLAFLRLIEIEEFISEDDPVAAERVTESLVEKASKLAVNPKRGRPLPELPGAPYRELVVGNYRVVYRVAGKSVDILTVFEGHRLLRLDEL